jgi:tartrate dehydratase beta subunit/fumarate hydratase class I family protein
VKEWGLKAIVGKTTMGKETMRMMVEKGCIHATPIGITPNFYQEQIAIQGVYWLEELGSIEAAWQLELKDFGPFLVDMDTTGRNYFDELDVTLEANRRKAYRRLSIPEDFEYTKLY